MERILTVQFVHEDENVVDPDGEDEEWDHFGNDQSDSHA